MGETLSFENVLGTILICFVASLGHAAAEIVEESRVFADTFDIDRVAASKTGCHTGAGTVRKTPDASLLLQTQWLRLTPQTEGLTECAQHCCCVEKCDYWSHGDGMRISSSKLVINW